MKRIENRYFRLLVLIIAFVLGIILFTVLPGKAQKYPKPSSKVYHAKIEFTQKFKDDMHNIPDGAWIQYLYTNADINYYFMKDSILFFDVKLIQGIVNISKISKHYWWINKDNGNLYIGLIDNPGIWIPLGKLRYRGFDGHMILKLKRK